MNALNPLAMRGLRVTGLKAAGDTALTGGEWWQAKDAGMAQAFDQNANPFLGPPFKAAGVGLTYVEPSVRDFCDDRWRDDDFRPSFYRPEIERNIGGSKVGSASRRRPRCSERASRRFRSASRSVENVSIFSCISTCHVMSCLWSRVNSS
jgi:hypothetical protein